VAGDVALRKRPTPAASAHLLSGLIPIAVERSGQERRQSLGCIRLFADVTAYLPCGNWSMMKAPAASTPTRSSEKLPVWLVLLGGLLGLGFRLKP
jgi:hypothetical protein